MYLYILLSPLNALDKPIPAKQSQLQRADSSQMFEIEYSQIVVGERIGNGNYGVVFKGRWRGQKVFLKLIHHINLLGCSETSYI